MPFIMALVRVLLGAIVAALPSLLARVLMALGISFITYKGLDVVVNELASNIRGLYSDLPSAMLQLFRLGGITTGFNIIIAALVAWATLKASSKVLAFMTKSN